jgi:hypothetical protein
MDQVSDRRPVRPPNRLWLGAPAIMVLACASAQAEPAALAAKPAEGRCTLGLVRKGVACIVRPERQALAQRAAFLINSLDRLAGAPAMAVVLRGAGVPTRPYEADEDIRAPGLSAHLDPARSALQPAAP